MWNTGPSIADSNPLMPPTPKERFSQATQLHTRGELAQAEEIYLELLEVKFRRADVKHLLGVVRVQTGAVDDGIGLLREALKAKPRAPLVHNHLANALMQLRDFREAVKHYRKAASLNPKMVEAYSNLANAYRELGEFDNSIKACRKAISLAPRLAEPHFNLALALEAQGKLTAAAQEADRAIRLQSNYSRARSLRQQIAGDLCDWDYLESAGLEQSVEQGIRGVLPSLFLSRCDDPVRQREAVDLFLGTQRGQGVENNREYSWERPERLRVGYLYARTAPTYAHLKGVLAAHDRQQVEVLGFSIGRGENGGDAFEKVHDLSELGDEAAAKVIEEAELDVLVDLCGLQRGHRLSILARRPAPVQVNYLGFPATMGGMYHDVLLCDATMLLDESAGEVVESVVQLPHAVPTTQREGEPAPDRVELGIPQEAVVYACLAPFSMLTRELLGSWIRILKEVPDSVLLLGGHGSEGETKLKSAVEAEGVSGERVIFVSGGSPREDVRVADVILDTALASSGGLVADALCEGIPVLTCAGRTMAARTGASVLTAANLPDMICPDLATYEALAVELGQDSKRRTELRKSIQKGHRSAPLYDSAGFARSLEKALSGIWESAREKNL